MFAHSLLMGSMPDAPTSAVGIYKRSSTAATYAYLAERALYRCLVEPADFLEITLPVRAPPTSGTSYLVHRV